MFNVKFDSTDWSMIVSIWFEYSSKDIKHWPWDDFENSVSIKKSLDKYWSLERNTTLYGWLSILGLQVNSSLWTHGYSDLFYHSYDFEIWFYKLLLHLLMDF